MPIGPARPGPVRPASPVLPLTLDSLAINKHQTLPGAAPPIDVILTSELRRRSRRARSPHKFALITGSGYWSEVAGRKREEGTGGPGVPAGVKLRQ